MDRVSGLKCPRVCREHRRGRGHAMRPDPLVGLLHTGAAIARVNAVVLAPSGTVATLETFLSGSSDLPPMVSAARLREVHGDVWGGNMLWEADRCVALIDWKTAGVGDPGVDLGSLRMQMALQYGQDAPAHVLEGWQRQAGRAAVAVPYWDAVAALNTPTVIHGEWLPGFAGDGSPLDAAAVTERRNAFLRTALDQLPTPIS